MSCNKQIAVECIKEAIKSEKRNMFQKIIDEAKHLKHVHTVFDVSIDSF